MIDTHCHLNLTKYFPDVENAIENAIKGGVTEMIVVGIDEETSRKAVQLAEKFPDNLYAAVGWHPTEVSGFNISWLEPIAELLVHPKVVAYGEIGLDFHWDKAPKEDQYLALEAQIGLANEFEKPIIFHCREANSELLSYLENNRPVSRFVLHCFSGTQEDAIEAIKMDAYFGFDGPITFPKSELSRQFIRDLPRDRILIETDSPFLAPVPFRGKPNEPANVKFIAEEVARCFSSDLDDAVSILDANARRFFGL